MDRYLFVGTGKMLDTPDIDPSDPRSHAETNSLYVIKDGTRTAAGTAPATPYSRSDLNRVDPTCTGTSTGTCLIGVATGRGWYQDASDSSQKIVSDVFADVQTVVYSFSKPQLSDPCLGTLTSTLFARDFTTGVSVLQDQSGTIQAGIDVGEGVAGIQLIQSQSGDIRLQATTFKPVPGKGQVFSFGRQAQRRPEQQAPVVVAADQQRLGGRDCALVVPPLPSRGRSRDDGRVDAVAITFSATTRGSDKARRPHRMVPRESSNVAGAQGALRAS